MTDMQLRKTRYFKPALVTLGIVLAAGALFGLRATQAQKDEKKDDAPVVLEFTPADVARVEVRELVRTVSFSGSLAPLLQTTVKSRVPGDVMRVHVREGQTVTEGQLIAEIDTIDLQSKLDAQVAALEEAKAKLTIAQKNRENNLQLLRQKFISQNAFDTTDSVYEAAAASLKSAEAQMRMAKKALSDAQVHAPFAGIVAKKMANAGEKVQVDSPLFTLVDLSRMEIEAPAPASEIPSIRAGQAVTFRVDGFADRAFEGRVERINPTADAGSRAITLYISVPNTDGALKGGMFAKGNIVLDRSSATPVIPATAVREEAGQTYVYTIENGKIGKRAVQIGTAEPQAGLVEVKSGLDNGMHVVSARVSGLKPGSPAILKPAAGAPSKPA
jgi:RND family efflux transporter MFP subunit